MAADSGAFLTGIIIDIVICIIAFIAFSILRVLKWSRNYFAPKLFTPGLLYKPQSLPYDGRGALFGWVLPIIRYKEAEIITSAGLDTAMYLRVLKFGFELFCYLTAWCLITMLPVNLTSDYIEELMSGPDADSYKFSNFDKCGLANIPPKSPKLWVHMISVYVITFITLWLLYKYSKDSILLRIMFIANSPKGRSSHTVLVTDIPAVAGETAKKVGSIRECRKTNASTNSAVKLKSVRENSATASPVSPPCKSDADKLSSATSARVMLPPGHTSSDQVHSDDRVTPSAIIRDASPSAPGMRRRRFTYDLKDESLNPYVIAKKMLKTGMTAKEMVESEFSGVYPDNKVENVEMICDQSALEPLIQEYKKRKLALEDYLDECSFRFSKGQEVKRKKTFILPMTLGKWGKEKYGSGLIKRVDAFEFLISRLRELDFQIEQEQPLSAQMVWPSAFITFRSRQDQACASIALHHHDTATWLVRAAPEPEELLWNNLGMILPMRSSRSLAMWCLFWAMCFFFMIPVAAVQALIESPRLADNPVLGPLVGNAVMGKLLASIIPGLALKLFLILVPLFITLMIKFAGAISLSEIDMGVVSRYYVFQVIVVFFGSVIMGSFFNQVTQWIENPASVISVLGTAIPMVATFFITYIAVNGLIVKPVAFIRIVGLVIYWIMAKLSGSPKARDRLWQEQKTTLGTTVIDHTITVLLGLVYSCINPIICPFVMTYFAVNAVIERYQNIYVTTRDYESSGKLWPRIFTQVLVALYIMQLAMIGLLGLKKFAFIPILIPVIFFTLAFHLVCLSSFSKPWRLMSLHDAADLDRLDHATDSEQIPPLEETQECPEAAAPIAPVSAQPLVQPEAGHEVVPAPDPAPSQPAPTTTVAACSHHQTYLSPAFKVVPGSIETLLSEASAMMTRIDEVQAAAPGTLQEVHSEA